MTSMFSSAFEEQNGKAILRLQGRLDSTSSPNLEKTLEDLLNKGYTKILLDGSELDYLSSAGMRLFLSTAKKLKGKKGDLILFSLSDDVLEIVKMAGFDRILHITQDEKEALSL